MGKVSLRMLYKWFGRACLYESNELPWLYMNLSLDLSLPSSFYAGLNINSRQILIFNINSTKLVGYCERKFLFVGIPPSPSLIIINIGLGMEIEVPMSLKN